eukprot:m.211587 g.211587  ORF g.211587 m.211587 type:complete len:662 (+) comp22133_c0_seq3:214-2199(+)
MEPVYSSDDSGPNPSAEAGETGAAPSWESAHELQPAVSPFFRLPVCCIALGLIIIGFSMASPSGTIAAPFVGLLCLLAFELYKRQGENAVLRLLFPGVFDNTTNVNVNVKSNSGARLLEMRLLDYAEDPASSDSLGERVLEPSMRETSSYRDCDSPSSLRMTHKYTFVEDTGQWDADSCASTRELFFRPLLSRDQQLRPLFWAVFFCLLMFACRPPANRTFEHYLIPEYNTPCRQSDVYCDYVVAANYCIFDTAIKNWIDTTIKVNDSYTLVIGCAATPTNPLTTWVTACGMLCIFAMAFLTLPSRATLARHAQMIEDDLNKPCSVLSASPAMKFARCLMNLKQAREHLLIQSEHAEAQDRKLSWTPLVIFGYDTGFTRWHLPMIVSAAFFAALWISFIFLDKHLRGAQFVAYGGWYFLPVTIATNFCATFAIVNVFWHSALLQLRRVTFRHRQMCFWLKDILGALAAKPQSVELGPNEELSSMQKNTVLQWLRMREFVNRWDSPMEHNATSNCFATVILLGAIMAGLVMALIFSLLDRNYWIAGTKIGTIIIIILVGWIFLVCAVAGIMYIAQLSKSLAWIQEQSNIVYKATVTGGLDADMNAFLTTVHGEMNKDSILFPPTLFGLLITNARLNALFGYFSSLVVGSTGTLFVAVVTKKL